jgi:hypothetical protein
MAALEELLIVLLADRIFTASRSQQRGEQKGIGGGLLGGTLGGDKSF